MPSEYAEHKTCVACGAIASHVFLPDSKHPQPVCGRHFALFVPHLRALQEALTTPQEGAR